MMGREIGAGKCAFIFSCSPLGNMVIRVCVLGTLIVFWFMLGWVLLGGNDDSERQLLNSRQDIWSPCGGTYLGWKGGFLALELNGEC